MSRAVSPATRLPYHLLLDVFELVSPPDVSPVHGGKLVGWTSFEAISHLAQVCGNWYEPARDLLYSSIAILSPAATDLFLRTARDNPALVERVRFLVIGLGDDEVPADGPSAGDVSLKLVEIIVACVNLRHLQVRPLHELARELLLKTILAKPLLSLVCSPRLCRPDVGWTTEFFRKTDIDELALPTLRALELDAWTDLTSHAPLTTVVPQFSPCPIVNLRLHFVMPDALLFALLAAAGPTLQVVDIYLEHVLSIEDTFTALRPSHRTLRNFRYVCNPTIDELAHLAPTTVPLFDRLFSPTLPPFEEIERLLCSATDISTNAFKNLPPSLRTLEVISYNHQAVFVSNPEFLDILTDRSVDISLRQFTLSDSGEVWDADYLEALRQAFLARGVIFTFKPDVEDVVMAI